MKASWNYSRNNKGKKIRGCEWKIFLKSFDVKENGSYVKKTVYVILGIKLDGRKELLGLWIGENETSKYWLSILKPPRDVKETHMSTTQTPHSV